MLRPIRRVLMIFVLSWYRAVHVNGATSIDFSALAKQEIEAARSQASSQSLQRGASGMLRFPRSVVLEPGHKLWRAPKNVWYVADFVSEREESDLLSRIQSNPQAWQEMGKRRLQRHGGVPSPSDGMVPEPMAPYLNDVCDAIVDAGAFPSERPPNHILINEYGVGSGISLHQDGSMYDTRVAVLSLGGTGAIHFYPSRPEGEAHARRVEGGEGGGEEGGADVWEERRDMFLERRSLLVFDAEAYTEWWHAILPRESDAIHERVANLHLLHPALGPGAREGRRTRVSLTVRRVRNLRREERSFATEEAAAERRRAAREWQRGVFDEGGG